MNLSLVELLTVISIIGVLIALLQPAGDMDFSHHFPATQPNSSVGFADVAGEYYQGNGRGRNLHLAILADGRYSFFWSGCTGVHCRESGTVRRLNGYISLTPLKAVDRKLERLFLPVPWGRRTYLIPEKKVDEFCDDVIQSSEPRSDLRSNYYVIGNDMPAEGLPDLPEPWASRVKKDSLD